MFSAEPLAYPKLLKAWCAEKAVRLLWHEGVPGVNHVIINMHVHTGAVAVLCGWSPVPSMLLPPFGKSRRAAPGREGHRGEAECRRLGSNEGGAHPPRH